MDQNNIQIDIIIGICNECLKISGMDYLSAVPKEIRPTKNKLFCKKINKKAILITYKRRDLSIALEYNFADELDNTKVKQFLLLIKEINLVLPILLLKDKELRDYQKAIWTTAYEKAISTSVGNEVSKHTIYSIIQKYKNWSQKTYEGKKKPFAVIIESKKYNGDKPFDFIQFLDNNFCATFTDGNKTVAILSADGKLNHHVCVGFIQTSTYDSKIELSTIDYVPFSNLCTGNSVGITLTPYGQIIIFKNRKIQYVYQKSKWVYYDSDEFVSKAYLQQPLPIGSDLYKHIFSDILEMSLTGSGGLIAVLSDITEAAKTFEGLTTENCDSKIQEKKNYSKNAISGEKYIAVNRTIRKELLCLDGAMIIDKNGEIVACGEIVKVGAEGSTGGGRTKAAKQLSNYGIAIKISEDGNVECYKNQKIFHQL